jgi:predicted outer membrane repeat protein
VPSTFAVVSPDDNAAERGTLRYAVANAVNGDTIRITPAAVQNTPIVLTQGELLLNQSVTIEGVGDTPETISGGGTSRVFDIAAGTSVTLSNLTITGGAGDPGDPTGGDGGGILNAGSLTLNGCRFSGNGPDSHSELGYVLDGGALANSGTLAASHCTFAGNSAFRGGAIYNTGQVALSDCAMTGNSAISFSGPGLFLAGDGGAMVNSGGAASLSGCTVSDNSAPLTASSFGGGENTGGVDSTGTLTISGSTVSGNSGRTVGGIKSSGILTISDCSVSANSGNVGGMSGSGEATIENSTFSGNGSDFAGVLSATACRFADASLLNQRKMALAGCDFIGDTAGVSNNGFMAVTSCNFTNSLGIANLSFPGNGGFTMTVSDSAFTGSILYNAGSILVTDCNFTACVGAVRNYSYMILNECTLRGNRNAVINVERGDSHFAPFLEVNDCTISGNTGDYGAAIRNDNNTADFVSLVATVDVNNCTISGNSASVDGGAIYNNNGILRVSGSTLSGNSADDDGGAIYNFVAPALHPLGSRGSTVTITNSILSGNAAGVDGGGIYNAVDTGSGYPGTLAVTASTLSNNSAGNQGGGIYNAGIATVSSSAFIGNSAPSGGGIYSVVGAMLTVSGSTFSANTPDAIFGSWIDDGGNTFS